MRVTVQHAVVQPVAVATVLRVEAVVDARAASPRAPGTDHVLVGGLPQRHLQRVQRWCGEGGAELAVEQSRAMHTVCIVHCALC